jgi:hypothetical protein
MIECPRAATCLFFTGKMQNMPATTDLMKRRYCYDDHAGCAIFMIGEKRGNDKIPADLFPNQHDRAVKLLQ